MPPLQQIGWICDNLPVAMFIQIFHLPYSIMSFQVHQLLSLESTWPNLYKIYGAYWALNVTWVWYEGMWPVLKNEVWSNSLEKDENDMIAMTMGCAGEPWRCSEAWEMRYVASHLTVVWLWWPVTIVRHTLPVLPKATECLLPHNPFHHTHSVIVTDI